MQRVDACIEVHLEAFGTGLRAEFTSQLEQRLVAKVVPIQTLTRTPTRSLTLTLTLAPTPNP